MKEHGFSGKKLLIGPSYPFTANDIFSKLHKSLEEQRGRRIGYEELGTLLGKSKGSAHAIFRVYRQRPLLEFFSLLKQLVPHHRHALVDALCRTAKEIKQFWARAEMGEFEGRPVGACSKPRHNAKKRRAVL